jgi:hypothetical protein
MIGVNLRPPWYLDTRGGYMQRSAQAFWDKAMEAGKRAGYRRGAAALHALVANQPLGGGLHS